VLRKERRVLLKPVFILLEHLFSATKILNHPARAGIETVRLQGSPEAHNLLIKSRLRRMHAGTNAKSRFTFSSSAKNTCIHTHSGPHLGPGHGAPPRSSRSSRRPAPPLPFQPPTDLSVGNHLEAGQACPLGLTKRNIHTRDRGVFLFGGYITTSFELSGAHSQNKSMPHASIPKCFRRSAFSPSSAVYLPARDNAVNRSPYQLRAVD